MAASHPLWTRLWFRFSRVCLRPFRTTRSTRWMFYHKRFCSLCFGSIICLDLSKDRWDTLHQRHFAGRQNRCRSRWSLHSESLLLWMHYAITDVLLFEYLRSHGKYSTFSWKWTDQTSKNLAIKMNGNFWSFSWFIANSLQGLISKNDVGAFFQRKMLENTPKMHNYFYFYIG